MLLFVDDQNVIQGSQEKVQHSVYNLHVQVKRMSCKFQLRKQQLWYSKMSLMIGAKIIIDSNILEEISHFSYLGNNVTYTL